jgi:hypothetical protein
MRLAILLLLAACAVGCGSSRASTPASVPYSDETDYAALKERTDCDGLHDLFLQVGREVQRAEAGSEAKKWATHYWAAVGARVYELDC